jgi:hypothetical protein
MHKIIGYLEITVENVSQYSHDAIWDKVLGASLERLRTTMIGQISPCSYQDKQNNKPSNKDKTFYWLMHNSCLRCFLKSAAPTVHLAGHPCYRASDERILGEQFSMSQ